MIQPRASTAAIETGNAGIVLTPDALPAPSGSIYFHHPTAEPGPDRVGSARIVTWGAPPPSMGLPGMWLTWYVDLRTHTAPEAAAIAATQPDARVMLDQENFLRFLPGIERRLIPGEPPPDETARILRTVLLTLFAIKTGLMPTVALQSAHPGPAPPRCMWPTCRARTSRRCRWPSPTPPASTASTSWNARKPAPTECAPAHETRVSARRSSAPGSTCR